MPRIGIHKDEQDKKDGETNLTDQIAPKVVILK
jgi:hypothetical protein